MQSSELDLLPEQLGYFLKNLDQTNINNAVRFSAFSRLQIHSKLIIRVIVLQFLSGMKEEL
jgi:hypothetical protein